MKNVLILIPYYKPGYRSGGPQRTIENICEIYGDSSNIYIITQNFDFGKENAPYHLMTDRWYKVDRVKVMYLKKSDYNFASIKKAYRKFDCIYSCGLFEKNTYLLLLAHRLLNGFRKKIYIAPMGVFSDGAFKIKKAKKELFVTALKYSGVLKNIIWSFTSISEFNEGLRVFRNKKYINNYIIAEDLPEKVDFANSDRLVEEKKDDMLRVVFLSRISEKKNLKYALQILMNAKLEKSLIFDIYGVIEDKEYWIECKDIINKAPKNIKICYRGSIKPVNVIDTFRQYDIFLFPTKGENFGHVIYESLASGCIPIISDQTPWNDIESNNCGKVVSLNDLKGFSDCILYYTNMKKRDIMSIQKRCIEYAINKYHSSVNESGYASIFC